jgi:hypothetical protein
MFKTQLFSNFLYTCIYVHTNFCHYTCHFCEKNEWKKIKICAVKNESIFFFLHWVTDYTCYITCTSWTHFSGIALSVTLSICTNLLLSDSDKFSQRSMSNTVETPRGGGDVLFLYILVYTDVPLEWVTFLTSQLYQWDAIFINLSYQWVDWLYVPLKNFSLIWRRHRAAKI